MLDFIIKFSKDTSEHVYKAFLFDIATKTGFIFINHLNLNIIVYELLGLVWLDWLGDIQDISRSYPDLVIEMVFEVNKGYKVYFIQNGQHYAITVPWPERYPEFDKELLVVY